MEMGEPLYDMVPVPVGQIPIEEPPGTMPNVVQRGLEVLEHQIQHTSIDELVVHLKQMRMNRNAVEEKHLALRIVTRHWLLFDCDKFRVHVVPRSIYSAK
jgi:hypothetical protein